MNIHDGYPDTAYSQPSIIRAELVKFGVHHVRDGACVACLVQQKALLDLAGAGIKTDYIMGKPGGPDSLSSLVNLLAGVLNSTVASVEDPNEYDFSGDPNWAANLSSYQQQLYQLVKATPALAGTSVLGPSMGSPANYWALIGSVAPWMDQGNAHPYAGGQVPDANLSYTWRNEGVAAPNEPLTATETGYNSALSKVGGNQPVSETAAAAYVPRSFLDFFSQGVSRTYLYEMINEWPDPSLQNQEANFGLLRNDYTEKPAYRTLRTLLSAVAPTQTGSFTRRVLTYQTPQRTSDLRTLMLQTGPSTYSLVLWRNASLWDLNAQRDIAVAPQSESVTLGASVWATAQRLDHSQATYIGQYSPGQQIAMPLDGMPVVVNLILATTDY